jgi:hypothetical protein
MAFQPGQSGNPGGRAREKPWRDALMRAIKRREPLNRDEKPQYIDLMAEAIVLKAAAGDVPAAHEIGDRVDGKAVQAIANDDESGEPFVIKVMRGAANA